jgi:N-sulfoglucosamine sulfohydrolase
MRRVRSHPIVAVVPPLMRRVASLVCGWVLAVECAAGVAAASEPYARPNLLLLVAEDLGPRIHAFGDPLAETPAIDRLAAEGLRFTNAFTAAAVCAPSRAALITGMHPISIGAQHMRASSRPAGGYASVPPPEVKAFPELLRAAGYYTFVTEKLDYQFSGHSPGTGPFTVWDAEDDPALWAGRDPGQPFFGMLNFLETHESGLFLPLGSLPHSPVHLLLQGVRAWRYGLSDGRTPVSPDAVTVPPYYPDTPTVRAEIARHYENIRRMDAAVAAVLARLSADGLLESTIIVWTTDHGDGLPRSKRELFDSGIHVPLVVRWPARWRPAGAVPGGADARLVSAVDLAPTFLDLAGVAPPPFLHGRSLASGPPREYVYASRDRMDEVSDRQRVVRDQRFAYIRSWHPQLPGGHPLAFRDNLESMREMRALHAAERLDAAARRWFEPNGNERLFDVRSDPHELRDLAVDPAYAAELARLRAALDAWLARVGDWSEVPEDTMVARFEPDGRRQRTPAPHAELVDGSLVLRSEGGASLGYRLDDGRWRLYTAPVRVPPGARVEAKAVRYGWLESEVVAMAPVGVER